MLMLVPIAEQILFSLVLFTGFICLTSSTDSVNTEEKTLLEEDAVFEEDAHSHIEGGCLFLRVCLALLIG